MSSFKRSFFKLPLSQKTILEGLKVSGRGLKVKIKYFEKNHFTKIKVRDCEQSFKITYLYANALALTLFWISGSPRPFIVVQMTKGMLAEDIKVSSLCLFTVAHFVSLFLLKRRSRSIASVLYPQRSIFGDWLKEIIWDYHYASVVDVFWQLVSCDSIFFLVFDLPVSFD